MSGLITTLGKESRMNLEDVEEVPCKLKSDIIKIDLQEAEVQRKYHGELRHALIMKGKEDPVIQIPDDEGDNQLFSNESMEKVSQTLQSFDAVVFNPIIMDLVFQKLDFKTIKKCRLICKNWNEMVSRILARQNGGYGLAVRLEEEKLKGMTDAFQQHTLQGLSSVVAYAPQNWFSKALLDHSFTRRTEIQSVLLDFGYRLRSIEITGLEFLFQDVHKILVDWCPNLEQLALPYWLHVEDGEKVLEDGYPKLMFTRPLKLTSLFMQEQPCISIVKASPNLKTLSLTSDRQSLQFFKELLNCPEITRNLEKFTLTEGYLDSPMNQIIKVFNSIQFSSNLKNLAIKVFNKFRNKELSEALEKLGGTLEKLVLIFMDVIDPELIILPRMNNLTELRYFTWARKLIHSIEFLTGMPDLKTLYLGQIAWYYDQNCFIDNLFSGCEELRRNPRKKLKELYLFGQVQSPSTTFEMMNTIFPNLTKLVVGIFVLKVSTDWEDLRNYYIAVLDGLSEFPHLRDLYLDFRRPESDEDSKYDNEEGFDYMANVFNQINKLSNLNRLTVRDYSYSTTQLAGYKLLKIPKLRQVTLIGLKLDRLAARDLRFLLHKHDIQFEIEDTDFEEDFRFLFEEQLQLTSRRRQFV